MSVEFGEVDRSEVEENSQVTSVDLDRTRVVIVGIVGWINGQPYVIHQPTTESLIKAIVVVVQFGSNGDDVGVRLQCQMNVFPKVVVDPRLLQGVARHVS